MIEALLAAVGVLMAGFFALFGNISVRLARVERDNRALWLWSQALVSAYNTWRAPGSPEHPPFQNGDD